MNKRIIFTTLALVSSVFADEVGTDLVAWGTKTDKPESKSKKMQDQSPMESSVF